MQGSQSIQRRSKSRDRPTDRPVCFGNIELLRHRLVSILLARHNTRKCLVNFIAPYQGGRCPWLVVVVDAAQAVPEGRNCKLEH